MAHLSLAYQDLEEVPVATANKYGPAVVDLDLSHNKLRSLSSIQAFSQLRALIVDNNELHSHVQWPFFPHLETLWINHNLISNLPLFVDKIATAYPKLRELSMMNNEAAPSFFNGGSKQQYEDYRCGGQ